MNTKMLLIILGAGIVTYFTRFPLMIISAKRQISPKLAKFMSFIAPAVLTSLIVPIIFIKQGVIDISFNNKYIMAAFITASIAYFTKNMPVSVIAGIGSVGILMYFF